MAHVRWTGAGIKYLYCKVTITVYVYAWDFPSHNYSQDTVPLKAMENPIQFLYHTFLPYTYQCACHNQVMASDILHAFGANPII